MLDDQRWVVSHLVVEPAVFFDRTRVPVSPALVHRAHWAARRHACVAIHREHETRLYDHYGRPRRGTGGAGSEPPTAPRGLTMPFA